MLGGLGAVEAPRSSVAVNERKVGACNWSALVGGVWVQCSAPREGESREDSPPRGAAISSCFWLRLGGGPCRDQATLNDTLVFVLEPILGTGCGVNPCGLDCRWLRGESCLGCAST